MFTNNTDSIRDEIMNQISINEYKTRTVSTDSKSLEELYGDMYPSNPNMIPDLKEPNNFQIIALEQDNNWKNLCSSSYYCHIRICGRVAQIKSEQSAFSMDDLFKLYRYNQGIGSVTLFGQTKIDYNKDANLWVFYISVENKVDKNSYIWIQPPHHEGSIQVICKGMTNKGLVIIPYDRNRAGFKHIEKYKDELESITKNHYKEFADSFKEANKFFEESKGRISDKPLNSSIEMPYKLLYNY